MLRVNLGKLDLALFNHVLLTSYSLPIHVLPTSHSFHPLAYGSWLASPTFLNSRPNQNKTSVDVPVDVIDRPVGSTFIAAALCIHFMLCGGTSMIFDADPVHPDDTGIFYVSYTFIVSFQAQAS